MVFDFRSFAESYVDELVGTLAEMPMDSLEKFWNLVEATRDRDGTVHFIGNGGSAGTKPGSSKN